MQAISEALLSQFDRTWQMLRATIERFPDDKWRIAPKDDMVAARWAYHAILTVEFYLSDSPDKFAWNDKIDWESAPENLPDRQETLTYLKTVEKQLHEKLQGKTDLEMLGTTAYVHTGENFLEHMLYVLRHTLYHMGELSMLLRLEGAEETEWQ